MSRGTSSVPLMIDRPRCHTPAEDPALLRGFRTPVRGHAFAARPPGGDGPAGRVRLVREADNPVDPLAVAVWSTTGVPWRIGYLDRNVAARLAPALDAGERLLAHVEGWVESSGGWHRPLVSVTPAVGARRPADRGRGLWGRPPGVTRRVVGEAPSRGRARAA